MFSNYDTEKTKNKVYINPNFNKPPVNSPLHVNPRFPHLLTNIPPNLRSKTRIHINPNFMKSTSDEFVKVDRSSITSCFVQNNAISSHFYYWNSHEPSKLENQTLAVPTESSRYSLVRQTVSKLPVETPNEKSKTTVQVTKYKSVPLNDIKSKLDCAKNALSKQSNVLSLLIPQNQSQLNNKHYTNSATSTSNNSNKFKLVNNKPQVLRNVKIKPRGSIDKHKRVSSNQLRLNRMIGNLKKNNIPCPMFRKFGKCLRKENSNCEFLHDKKHVSVCRKFVKGLCHDKDCLLSHDLTMKKMPTCYFFLKGACTKPDCPYLHVKLNEKVKVCPDFQKGYCERGSKCLQRHCNVQVRQKENDSLLKKSILQKNSKLKFKKSASSNGTISFSNNSLTENNKSDRYYQENKGGVSATETCEIIKPTRCKLGSLPSFIQL